MSFRGDVRTFGLLNALKVRLVGKTGGLLRLDVPGFGPIVVRQGDSDLETVRQTFSNREYALGNARIEERLLGRYRAILAAGRVPVIIDAGANIGVASLWFRALYPEAAVVAVEPDPANAQILRQNVAAHRNVSVVEAAIGSESGFVTLSRAGSSWGVQTQRADGGCPIVTMQELIASVPNGEAFIAKVDIEGFEEDLFSGNLAWLRHTFAVFIEPHDWMLPARHTSRSFQKAMAAEEFQLLLRGENLVYVRLA